MRLINKPLWRCWYRGCTGVTIYRLIVNMRKDGIPDDEKARLESGSCYEHYALKSFEEDVYRLYRITIELSEIHMTKLSKLPKKTLRSMEAKRQMYE